MMPTTRPRIRVGTAGIFRPVPWDRLDGDHLRRAGLSAGALIRVTHPYGCPPPGTMGHCHVDFYDLAEGWRFAGLIHCNSLQPLTREQRRQFAPVLALVR